MLLIECIVGVFILLYVVQYFQRKRQNEMISNLRGPFSIPLLGCLHEAYRLRPENFLQKSKESNAKYGKTFRIWVLNRLVLALADPKVAEVLLSSQTHTTKHHLYNLLRPWLGTGLLMSDGPKWHYRRKITTPAFHFKILEQFIEVFDQQSDLLVKQLEQHCDTGIAFDLYPFICLSALDIIGGKLILLLFQKFGTKPDGFWTTGVITFLYKNMQKLIKNASDSDGKLCE